MWGGYVNSDGGVQGVLMKGVLGVYRPLTALFTKPPVAVLPGWTPPPGPFQLPAPFMAYGSFRNCTRQNHGTAGNREAGGFVNSAVRV